MTVNHHTPAVFFSNVELVKSLFSSTSRVHTNEVSVLIKACDITMFVRRTISRDGMTHRNQFMIDGEKTNIALKFRRNLGRQLHSQIDSFGQSLHEMVHGLVDESLVGSFQSEQDYDTCCQGIADEYTLFWERLKVSLVRKATKTT